MVYSKYWLLAVVLMCMMPISHAQDYLAIQSYKCADFLSDATTPDQPQKLIRSMTMIAWATGFAAAHQQNKIRADESAMHLVAVMAGDACRKDPNKLAIDAIVETIRHYANVRKNVK